MGVKYMGGAMILTGVNEDFPQFAQILDIYVIDNGNPMAYCQMFSTQSFEHHFHSYQVTKDLCKKVFCLQDIVTQHSQVYMLRHLNCFDSTTLIILVLHF